jgi:hypothetical protein
LVLGVKEGVETMNKRTIFARARPSVVRLTEKYTYHTDVSSNPHIARRGMPTGLVEVIIPYDGQEYFSTQAVEDIEWQMPEAWERERVTARIGHIGLTNYSNTDLEQRLDFSFHHNILPLDILVQGEGLQGLDSLRDDRHACRTTYDYRPEWPETTPLKLAANIYDEEVIKEVLIGAEKEQNEQTTVLETVTREIAQQVGFSRSLVFAFDLELALPGRVGRAQDDQPPELVCMALEWPVATSHRLVHLIVAGEDRPLVYNPERGVIEWGDIPFEAHGKSEGTDLYAYRTPSITLLVDQPGELYRREQLGGEVRIEIPRLFSALRLAYFSVEGWQKDADIESRTILAIDLTLYLEDLFERKMFSPYQHLQFEGVVLDEMRVTDILTLLEDQGFTPSYRKLVAERSGMQRYLVEGIRQEGPGELVLWMLVEGTRSRTTRRKQIPGGQTFTTELETGNMVIYMRGQLRRDSERLVGVMNEIQKLLKERFLHVSTIE